ncbi:MAG: ribonuclease HII [Fimbriimonadaceae bacterium]|nr:ribonuclease HII [Fimbriimonadaceae bacterium]
MESLPFDPYIAGVDEAGRGPIAGPLVVAAAILPEGFDASGIHDSKQLSFEEREQQFSRIVAEANYSIQIVSHEEVDRLNILRATLQAMSQALRELDPQAKQALIDGNQLPPNPPCPVETVVKGDGKYAAIAAASILAKVTRDRLMIEANLEYPGYGFDRNFGYYNPVHVAALEKLGPCPIHRRSFEPIKSLVNQPLLF